MVDQTELREGGSSRIAGIKKIIPCQDISQTDAGCRMPDDRSERYELARID